MKSRPHFCPCYWIWGVDMAHPMGESKDGVLRLDFDRRLRLEFHGSKVSSDAGLLPYRELDDAVGLTEIAGDALTDTRRGKNGRHGLVGQFRQSVFGRLGGYDDVNDADRLSLDPVMRWIVGGQAVTKQAASTSQMGRFETELLATDGTVEALADMNGVWIDKVHDRHPPTKIILDMDSSVSPTHGEQEGSAYNGHFGCSCYHPLFLFNQFGDLERSSLRPGNVHSADDWEGVLKPVVVRYKGRKVRLYFRGDAAFASPDIYDYLEAEGFLYAIRLPKNQILQESIGYLLTRPVGRPPNHVQRYYASFSYQAGSWDRKRRVVAKVEWHPGELVPRVGLDPLRGSSVTNLSRPAPPSGWWPSTINEAKRSNTSRKARTRSNGRGCRAASSATTRFGSSFTPWLTIWPTSCGRWPCRRKWSTGR